MASVGGRDMHAVIDELAAHSAELSGAAA
jgi:hypothetical protein